MHVWIHYQFLFCKLIMRTSILIACLMALVAAENWVIIIGGSNGYSNYRHQANIAHQYHQYLDYGVKPEHIIVFDYDDVPESKSNPFPGKLYNLPGDDAREYYEGLIIDYKGEEITKENLFNCMLGVDNGNGKKVLKSTADDKVFINYYDHGAPGLIALINDRVKKDELQDVLKQMHEKKMYKELVFYLEACDSATMMEDFPDDLNIYVVTSTDAAVSGWACFCPPEDIVHGKHIGACISEEFGYAYMKDMDDNGGKDTLAEQFQYIYNSMSRSKPKQWADFSFNNETLAEFFGVEKKIVRPSQLVNKPNVFWDTRDNNLLFLANQLARTDIDGEFRQELMKNYSDEVNIREKVDALFKNIVTRTVGMDKWDEMMKPVQRVNNPKCYYDAVEAIDKIIPVNDYELKFFTILSNVCDVTGLRTLPIY